MLNEVKRWGERCSLSLAEMTDDVRAGHATQKDCAEAIMEKVRKHCCGLVAAKVQELEGAQAELDDVAGGCAGGASWKDAEDVKAADSFETLLAVVGAHTDDAFLSAVPVQSMRQRIERLSGLNRDALALVQEHALYVEDAVQASARAARTAAESAVKLARTTLIEAYLLEAFLEDGGNRAALKSEASKQQKLMDLNGVIADDFQEHLRAKFALALVFRA